jgi:hypothetical protein
MPLVHGKHPRTTWGLAIRALAWGGGGAGRIPASRPRSRPGKRWGMTTCSPRAWGWPELGRRSCRSGRTAMAGGGGRDGSVLATASARLGLQATRIGPTRSRGGSRRIGRTGGWTGRRACRRQRGWRGGQWWRREEGEGRSV